MRTQAQSISEVFSNSIREELITGLDRDVFVQCLDLLENDFVNEINIRGLGGRQICSEKPSSLMSSFHLEVPILYGTDRNSEIAGMVRIGFRSSLVGSILQRVVIILILIVVVLFAGYWAVGNYLLKKETDKFGRLADILENSDLQAIEQCSSLFPGHQSREIESLCNGVEELAKNWRSWQKELVNSERLRAINESTKLLAHDMKSPVGAIRVAYSMLEEKPVKSKALLDKGLSRIETMLNELMVSDSSSPANLNVKVLKVGHHFTDLFTQLALNYESRDNVSLKLIDQGTQELNISLDVNLVDRAVDNLVKNSVEAASGKQITVAIILAVKKDELKISIEDDGPGLPQGILKSAADGVVESTKPGGHGLGLYQVRRVTQMHGGTFHIDSREGAGTTVTMSFPITSRA